MWGRIIMKRILVAGAVALPAAATGQMLAPEIAVAQGFGGFHLDFGGGGAIGSSSQHDNGFVPTSSAGPTGGTGGSSCSGTCTVADGHYRMEGGLVGGGLGYDMQSGSWVLGIATDLSAANVDGSSAVCGTTSHPCGTSLDSLGTLRGRVGWAFGGVLPYVTGGFAYGEVHAWDSMFGVSGSSYRSGWTIGAGIEALLTPNWSVKFEYLHVDLGTSSLFDIVPGVPERIQLDADVFRAAITYRFNWGYAGAPPTRPYYTK